MKPCGSKNNPPSVPLAEFTAEAYLKVDNFLAGEPFSER
jgi:hypothetical protein